MLEHGLGCQIRQVIVISLGCGRSRWRLRRGGGKRYVSGVKISEESGCVGQMLGSWERVNIVCGRVVAEGCVSEGIFKT